ncbi:MAG: hypothetical protein DRP35_00035 [Candidatus Zixiibacteriota bacterium]|nr:MAG: hypothetical protein DRP35_00035 [candidate division Zixibacteria bacterium]
MKTQTKKIFGITLFVIFIITSINISLYFFYKKTEKMLDYQLSQRLKAIANLSSSFIKPEQIDKLNQGNIDNYIQLFEIIQTIKTADSLSEVFIINSNYDYLITTSFDEGKSYFLKEINSPYIDSVLLDFNLTAIASPSYHSGNLYLKSAFASLNGSEGFPIAVIGIEANVDYFDVLSELKFNLYYSSIISIVAGLIFGLFFVFYQIKLNKAEQILFLNQTNSYLGRMVAVVSHEIKNPLMIIRASAERLRKKTESEESSFILEETDRLNQIVTGYLDYAKAGDGAILINEIKDEIHFNQFASNLKKHISEKFDKYQIEWVNNNKTADFLFSSYPRALRQIMINLLINGAEACINSNRQIILSLEGYINNDIKIKVTDYGPGLSKKEIKKIFEPFYTTKNTGSGLGLYLTKKLVVSMKGQIYINSVKDKKTEVTITLPK